MRQKLRFEPGSGHIPDLGSDAEVTVLPDSEAAYLRDLAAKVAEIAQKPEQEARRDLWVRHNALQPTRPPVLIFPENSWYEILPPSSLRLADGFWRNWEWYLRHIIYQDLRLRDDRPLEGVLWAPMAHEPVGFGVQVRRIEPEEDSGAFTWVAPIQTEGDLDQLRMPRYEVRQERSKRIWEATGEVFGDVLEMKQYCGLQMNGSISPRVVNLRGLEQTMIDMYDRPEWLHRLVSFLTDGLINLFRQLESLELLTDNTGTYYSDSGGLSNRQPAGGNASSNLSQVWGFVESQDFAAISPEMHEEFAIDYERKVCELFQMSSYGCCEPLTRKFSSVLKIPRLRRVSVSPWCDVAAAAEVLEDRYLLSWKPHPSMVTNSFNADEIRRYLRENLDRMRNCRAEVILKDTITVENDPTRLGRWLELAREEIAQLSLTA